MECCIDGGAKAGEERGRKIREEYCSEGSFEGPERVNTVAGDSVFSAPLMIRTGKSYRKYELNKRPRFAVPLVLPTRQSLENEERLIRVAVFLLLTPTHNEL